MKKNPKTNSSEISRQVTMQWNKMDENQKKPFKKLEKQDEERY